MSRYLFFIFAAFITLTQTAEIRVLDLIFIACGVLAFWYNRFEPNISSLLVILVFIRSVEVGFWLVTDMKNAFIFYPSIIFVDCLALYFIANRNRFLAKLEYRRTGSITPHKYVYSNADYILSLIYKCYLAITLISFLEHLIRHVDKLGLPESWGNPDLMVAYNLYAPLKLTLNTLEYVAILTTAHRIMRSERYVNA